MVEKELDPRWCDSAHNYPLGYPIIGGGCLPMLLSKMGHASHEGNRGKKPMLEINSSNIRDFHGNIVRKIREDIDPWFSPSFLLIHSIN